MKFVVDVCLSHVIAEALNNMGHTAAHWSTLGGSTASDATIMAWAAERGHTIVTADLDFGDLLFLTKASTPSVIMFRCADHAPGLIIALLDDIVGRFNVELTSGCLISADEVSARVRTLPLE